MRKKVTNTEPMWENWRAAAGVKSKNDWVARFAPEFASAFPISYLFLAQKCIKAFEVIQENMPINSTDLLFLLMEAWAHFRSVQGIVITSFNIWIPWLWTITSSYKYTFLQKNTNFFCTFVNINM